jgi:BirA family biotin operon repressor/biotin-[acetyl-CoA-carboxylase] ligase
MESRLSKEKIQSELDRMGISYPEIKLYGITDSTNLQAVALGQAGGGDAIFIAEEQTAGKGRRGRSFASFGGVGIYISFLTHPSAAAECAVGITAYTAVKMCRAIESMTGGDIRIKWVNDLYLGGKKLAGILTEGAFDSEGKLSFAVVGIGVNVLKCDLGEELNAIATSVEEGFGVQLDRSILTARMIAEFLTGYGNFDDDAIVDEYIRRSFLIGKDITVHKLSESYPATVKAINRDYSLLVDRDGKEERIFTGEVSVRER